MTTTIRPCLNDARYFPDEASNETTVGAMPGTTVLGDIPLGETDTAEDGYIWDDVLNETDVRGVPSPSPQDEDLEGLPRDDTDQTQNPEDVPDDIGEPTAAALAVQGGFTINDRGGVEWYFENVFDHQLEIEALELKARRRIEAIEKNLKKQIAPHRREIRSFEWRFGQQVDAVCRQLIAEQREGKTVAFTYGSASMKTVRADIEVLQGRRAIAYVSERAPACVRQRPLPAAELELTAFKKWMQRQLREVHEETLKRQLGDLAKANFAVEQMLRLEYSFIKPKAEYEKLTMTVGSGGSILGIASQ